ncbi:MAG: hypothetical protein ACREDE_05355 [Thermoplasmata archaeon]
MRPRKVLDWLLAEEQPSVRYRTLTELLGRGPDDPDVRAARDPIPRTGWAAEILSERSPEGWWVHSESLYTPKYLSTHWRMLLLSDLGLTREVPAIRESCELWMRRFAATGGGVGGNSKGRPHHCVAGNLARALLRFGYADDDRVRRTLEWLTESADPKGGWSCFERGRNLDSWEGLSAFAAYPRAKWTPRMQECVERAAEFFLDRELHRQGDRYPPWYRFHYPVHYYYDLLVGLDLLTSLGYASDRRLKFALAHLRKKRRPDGRWNLDAVHPDVDGAMAEWFRKHPKQRPVPIALERPGAPSKIITLTALKVLDRVDR